MPVILFGFSKEYFSFRAILSAFPLDAIKSFLEEQKAFFQKWKRLKVSINHIFNAFDHLECIWDELKEEAKTSNSDASNIMEKPKIEMIDTGVQTEALEKEPEKNEDEEVLGWNFLKTTILFIK